MLYEYNGKKQNLVQWAKEYGINSCTLWNRLKKGWDFEKALTTKPNANNHGLTSHNLYDVWSSMVQRCYNKKNKGYPRYGGRGIKMCSKWRKEPKSFIDWAFKHGYKKGLEIDRIDNNKGYSPRNCRWVTVKVNTNNREITKYVEFEGKSRLLSELCEEYKVSYSKVLGRLNRRWTIEKALSESTIKPEKYFTYNGQTKSITDWAKEVGISRWTMSERIQKNGGVFNELCLKSKGEYKKEDNLLSIAI